MRLPKICIQRTFILCFMLYNFIALFEIYYAKRVLSIIDKSMRKLNDSLPTNISKYIVSIRLTQAVIRSTLEKLEVSIDWIVSFFKRIFIKRVERSSLHLCHISWKKGSAMDDTTSSISTIQWYIVKSIYVNYVLLFIL